MRKGYPRSGTAVRRHGLYAGIGGGAAVSGCQDSVHWRRHYGDHEGADCQTDQALSLVCLVFSLQPARYPRYPPTIEPRIASTGSVKTTAFRLPPKKSPDRFSEKRLLNVSMTTGVNPTNQPNTAPINKPKTIPMNTINHCITADPCQNDYMCC